MVQQRLAIERQSGLIFECHEPLAVDEADPQILKTLNLADRIASMQKLSAQKPAH